MRRHGLVVTIFIAALLPACGMSTKSFQPFSTSSTTMPRLNHYPQPLTVDDPTPVILRLDKPGSARRAAAQLAPKPLKTRDYTVTSGDTLATIAQRHRTSIEQLMMANNLPTTRIALGQTLVVPAMR